MSLKELRWAGGTGREKGAGGGSEEEEDDEEDEKKEEVEEVEGDKGGLTEAEAEAEAEAEDTGGANLLVSSTKADRSPALSA